MRVTSRDHRGWEVLRLETDALAVEVVPGQGGDIITVAPPSGDNVLWTSPWGLRQRGAVTGAGDSHATAIDLYPGGWQTLFPNGGDACVEHGVEWSFHGEAWLAPFDWALDGDAVVLRTRLVRSPFELSKRLAIEDDTLVVTEVITNAGGMAVEVMWGAHPAFGPPLVTADCRLETNARAVVVDDARDTPTTDLALGARGPWPHVPGRRGADVDFRAVPGEGAGIERMAYLTGFEGAPWVTLTNEVTGLCARLEWDASVLPHAWYWLEANATMAFPWYGAAYVLAVEPASSYPARGLATVRRTTETQLTVAAGESRTSTIRLAVTNLG